jgi:hypothetical protein
VTQFLFCGDAALQMPWVAYATFLLNDPDHWHDRAAEMRALSEALNDVEAPAISSAAFTNSRADSRAREGCAATSSYGPADAANGSSAGAKRWGGRRRRDTGLCTAALSRSISPRDSNVDGVCWPPQKL